MKKSPYLNLSRIEFIVTYHCSGRCIHCSVDNQAQHQAHHVPTEQVTAAIRWLAEQYPVSSVMTFGGEPLLYPDVVCAIHDTARQSGVAARQLITNGYFSKDDRRIGQVARQLQEAGINDLLLSVDAFHQQTIPLSVVRSFAIHARHAGLPIRVQPAWLVNRSYEHPYNAETASILAEFDAMGISASSGNDIFLAGRAKTHLASHYPPPQLDLSQYCGAMPYSEPLTEVSSLSIVPNGDVMVCSFVIGNLLTESIAEIVARYDPYQNDCMRAIVTGGAPALLQLAEERGLAISADQCYSVCDLCRQVCEQLN
ncbi:MAG: radical SAM protein [Clostridiales bacterium]|nr:radical SAM protein [Clostridiales bacterium]